MKLTIKTRMKFLKAQFKEYMTRKRYVGRYPKVKRFILGSFIVVVNMFIGWQVSLNIPEVKISFSNDPIIYEQKALAKEVEIVKEEVKPVVNKNEELLNMIFKRESSEGKNNYSKCEAIGKYNRYGFGIPGDGTYLCFDKDDDRKAAEGWILQKQAAGWSELKILCTYSGNHYQECSK